MDSSLFDKIFRDSEGNIVIAQPPNLPLATGISTTILKLIFTTGNFYVALDTLAFGSLFTWAWLELFDGVNYFRRTLGLIALLVLMNSKLLNHSI